MLREQRPFKFFNLPATYMKEFVREAKGHGLLYVPIRNKQKGDYIELVVFADDAAKIQRIYDNLGLDYVKAEAGEAIVEKAVEQEKQAPAASQPGKTETVQTEQGAVEFEVGGFEDDFNIAPPQQDAAENFTSGREKEAGEPAERNPSAPSSPSKSSSPNSINPKEPEHKPSVKKELQEIKQEQVKKKEERAALFRFHCSTPRGAPFSGGTQRGSNATPLRVPASRWSMAYMIYFSLRTLEPISRAVSHKA